MFQIDSVKYVGVGKSSEEANENAAIEYLNSITTNQKIIGKLLKDAAPNSSFITLNNMFTGLNFRAIHQDENGIYGIVVQVI